MSGRVEHLADGVTDRWVTIYALCEPIEKWKTGPVRYVGKTVRAPSYRAKAHVRVAKRAPRLPIHWWLKKHAEVGDPLHIRHLERIPPGHDWDARERYWIKTFRSQGAQLLNMTDGGEGLSGHRMTETHKNKIAAALRTGGHSNCETCGAQFWRKRSAINKGNNRFCSRECSNRRAK